MAIWSSAEYHVGMIAGSIPPCRSLVVDTFRKVTGGKDSPHNEKTTAGVSSSSSSRSGKFYSIRHFSARVTDSFDPSRAPGSDMSRGGSRILLQKIHRTMPPWNMKANRGLSQDGETESILPLHHSVAGTNLDTAIGKKTVDVRIGTSGDR